MPDNGSNMNGSRLGRISLIWDLAWNDFRTQYAGSVFGILWAFAHPLVTVLMYWFVFQIALGSGPVNGHPFVLWLIAGLVPWMFFQDAMSYGADSLTGYSFLVKKVSFNIAVLPVVKVTSAMILHAMTLGIALVFFTAMHAFPGIQILQLFYYSFCTYMLALGFAYLDCSVVVFFRDWAQVINIALQVGVWVTPILWQLDKVIHRMGWIFIFKLNPLCYIV